ncbi:hypothetical protein EYC84_003676 [Monilinia fructicola]|uniref:Uncharacterized protein n=1 Tax=Monilinia fructicola TaxID=38448 RepID=A0A5M9JWZ0_MONFR|nr:hypothetical protein EYC84_003676 [Monilinia fructicola]
MFHRFNRSIEGAFEESGVVLYLIPSNSIRLFRTVAHGLSNLLLAKETKDRKMLFCPSRCFTVVYLFRGTTLAIVAIKTEKKFISDVTPFITQSTHCLSNSC